MTDKCKNGVIQVPNKMKTKPELGFTIFELLILLAVSGIILAFCVTRSNALKNSHSLHQAARDILDILNHYSHQSCLWKRKTSIYFDLESSSLWLVNSPDSKKLYRLPNNISFGKISFGNIERDRFTTTFESTGTVTPGSVQIKDLNRSGLNICTITQTLRGLRYISCKKEVNRDA